MLVILADSGKSSRGSMSSLPGARSRSGSGQPPDMLDQIDHDNDLGNSDVNTSRTQRNTESEEVDAL
jgi:hypothetical protein